MGKRKRGEDAPSSQAEASSNGIKNYHAATNPVPVHIQIITGSYDKVLHGCVATVSHDLSNGENVSLSVDFRDNFLFNAHTSAIRCLAISPVSGDARAPVLTLASGGSDERINLYQLSASVAPRSSSSKAPVELPGEAREVRDPRNKELGSLLHHASSITALCFPTRSKLLSGANDNTIAVSRARDWTVLSTFKAPIPKAVGRPSGDTAPLGGTPAGISDFAVHPSMKLMVSVGKGEKCMRLWNLVTGKKAGALSFGRETLRAVGEGKWGSGEARRVTWNSSGDEFAIAFEHGVVIYGMDCKPKFRAVPQPKVKIHQVKFLRRNNETENQPDLLAISTEIGRIVIFSLSASSRQETGIQEDDEAVVPLCTALAQLGGHANDSKIRIKDFEVFDIETAPDLPPETLVVAARSNGLIQLWTIGGSEIDRYATLEKATGHANGDVHITNGAEVYSKEEEGSIPQVGRLVGSYETGNRLTCLKAFVLMDATCSRGGLPTPQTEDKEDEREAEDGEEEFNGIGSEDDSI